MANSMPEIKVAIAGRPVGTVIHKYEIRLDSFSLFMVKGAIIRDIAEQYGDMFMWVERPVDSQVDCIGRTFEVFGTGHEMPDITPKQRVFLKTVHHSSGLVLHYYEVI
jgi:hypothetical protein